MRHITPVTVRCSLVGRLAALLLVLLIVSPLTAPFSTMSGGLEASPSGPADSVKSEATQVADALVEVTVAHVELSWVGIRFHAPSPTAIAQFAHVNRILRL